MVAQGNVAGQSLRDIAGVDQFGHSYRAIGNEVLPAWQLLIEVFVPSWLFLYGMELMQSEGACTLARSLGHKAGACDVPQIVDPVFVPVPRIVENLDPYQWAVSLGRAFEDVTRLRGKSLQPRKTTSSVALPVYALR